MNRPIYGGQESSKALPSFINICGWHCLKTRYEMLEKKRKKYEMLYAQMVPPTPVSLQ